MPAFAPLQSPLAPQYCRLVCGSVHAPPQVTCPAAHDTAHTPLVHTCPDGHIEPAFAPAQSPEAPQNCRLLSGSTHTPPQFNCPARHVTLHIPPLHT